MFALQYSYVPAVLLALNSCSTGHMSLSTWVVGEPLAFALNHQGGLFVPPSPNKSDRSVGDQEGFENNKAAPLPVTRIFQDWTTASSGLLTVEYLIMTLHVDWFSFEDPAMSALPNPTSLLMWWWFAYSPILSPSKCSTWSARRVIYTNFTLGC